MKRELVGSHVAEFTKVLYRIIDKARDSVAGGSPIDRALGKFDLVASGAPEQIYFAVAPLFLQNRGAIAAMDTGALVASVRRYPGFRKDTGAEGVLEWVMAWWTAASRADQEFIQQRLLEICDDREEWETLGLGEC